MYTEDDEKIEVKKDKSNVKYSDFYTSFNDIGKEDKNSKKGKKKTYSKQKEVAVKEEEDYQDFYNSNSEDEDENKDNKGKRNIIILIVAGIVLLILIMLIVILLNMKNKVTGDIELAKTDIVLDVGGKEYISYNIVNTESMVTSKFVSSDETIAIVSDNGEVTAVNKGEAIITIQYTIDGLTREKKCNVKVNDNSSVNQNVSLILNLSGGKNNAWTNKDVTINPIASSVFDIDSIKYAINCDSNCEYKDITDSKITISSSGVTKVKVIAKDKGNQEITKEVTIKIDKEAPNVTLNSGTDIKSSKDVEVCATCTDGLSGCKKAKVCKKFTTSKSNQTITVEDAAGNTKTSKAFNVTINKTGAPCILSVASDGTVRATLREEATYYGFNSNYSGSNTLSKKVNISSTKKGSYAQIVNYYVKNKNGTGGKCFITVIKKCTCKDNSSNNNCETTCTYTSQ